MSLDSTGPLVSAATPVIRTDNRGLLAIGVFELIKAVLFLAAAAGVFHLVHHDTRVELIRLLRASRISGDSAFVKSLLLKTNVITDPRKRILGGMLSLYAALHAAEGVGILWRKRWAEYFTVIMTSIWIPLEVYTVVHHVTHATVVVLSTTGERIPAGFGSRIFALEIAGLLANTAIVWFLIYHLRRGGREKN